MISGSIGTQALDVIGQHPDQFEVELLTANNNSRLLIEQARRFNPSGVVICNPDKGRYRMSFGTFKSFTSIRTETNPEGMPIAFFNGEPVDLPATPAPVTLTDEQAQEYADLQEIADKLEEVFF